MKTSWLYPYTRAVISFVLLVLLVLNFTKTVDDGAKRLLRDSFNNALITFAVVRSIDGVISAVQGTEVTFSVGIGATSAPGEILDPINDLIERFSWIVLMASTSLGAQRILLDISTTFVAQLAVLLSIGALMLILWRSSLLPRGLQPLIVRVSVTLLLLRFLIPVVVLANETVYCTFLSDQYQRSQKSLEQAGGEIQDSKSEENTDTSTETEDGIFSTVRRWFGGLISDQHQDSNDSPEQAGGEMQDSKSEENTDTSTETEDGIFNVVRMWRDTFIQQINVSSRLDEIETRVENAIEHIVNLIVVFILQTLVFPLLFLWLAIKSGGILIRGKFWNSADT